jgi:DNA mismatch repair ATPase MutS
MMPFLLYRDQDFDLRWNIPRVKYMLMQDLELDILFNFMACEDEFIFEVVKKVVLLSVADTDTIFYRQSILKDCIKNHEIVRNIYHLLVESIEKHKKNATWYPHESADSIRERSIVSLEHFVNMLTKLRNMAGEHGGTFESEGFRELFAMFNKELTDENFASIRKILEELKIPNGTLIGVEFGKGSKGTNYALQRYQKIKKHSWIRQFVARERPSQYHFTINPYNEREVESLLEMKDRGINPISNVLAQSSDYILSFFTALKTELAFYMGCLNLSEQLTRLGEPLCFPIPCDHGNRALSFEGLYDVCLALKMKQKVVGNDANAEGKDLVIITGANRGGKSSLLRSVGLAQLMMQCGSFVPARSICSDMCTGIFTHFKREEDRGMRSGKLDEELKRMSEIVDNLTPDCMVLFNESFAATNEREGSEISRHIVCALLQRRIKVIFVTHLYEFSRGLYENKMENALFLRAERKPDGERTFRVTEGEPLQTSYGEDLYSRIFSGLDGGDIYRDLP